MFRDACNRGRDGTGWDPQDQPITRPFYFFVSLYSGGGRGFVLLRIVLLPAANETRNIFNIGVITPEAKEAEEEEGAQLDRVTPILVAVSCACVCVVIYTTIK